VVFVLALAFWTLKTKLLEVGIMEEQLLERLKKIKLLALDFDGVLTDGYVHFRQDGIETVCCSRKDSLGTNMLQACGIYVVVISKETNPVVEMRCKKMKVDCYYDVQDD